MMQRFGGTHVHPRSQVSRARNWKGYRTDWIISPANGNTCFGKLEIEIKSRKQPIFGHFGPSPRQVFIKFSLRPPPPFLPDNPVRIVRLTRSPYHQPCPQFSASSVGATLAFVGSPLSSVPGCTHDGELFHFFCNNRCNRNPPSHGRCQSR